MASTLQYLFICLFVYIYLFILERKKESIAGQREEQTPCWVRSLPGGSISGPRDHDPSGNQDSDAQLGLSHPSTLIIFKYTYIPYIKYDT